MSVEHTPPATSAPEAGPTRNDITKSINPNLSIYWLSYTMMSLSFLDLVNICDNVHFGSPRSSVPDPSFDSKRLIPWRLTPGSPVIGLLRPTIVEQLIIENEISMAWDVQQDMDSPDACVCFSSLVDTPPKRTAVVKELCERWRDVGLFGDVCGPSKWRDERYPVYRDPFGPHDYPLDGNSSEGNYAFEMERSCCALFGVVTYGVHMTIYLEDDLDGVRIWVPTRARTKQTYGISISKLAQC